MGQHLLSPTDAVLQRTSVNAKMLQYWTPKMSAMLCIIENRYTRCRHVLFPCRKRLRRLVVTRSNHERLKMPSFSRNAVSGTGRMAWAVVELPLSGEREFVVLHFFSSFRFCLSSAWRACSVLCAVSLFVSPSSWCFIRRTTGGIKTSHGTDAAPKHHW